MEGQKYEDWFPGNVRQVTALIHIWNKLTAGRDSGTEVLRLAENRAGLARSWTCTMNPEE